MWVPTPERTASVVSDSRISVSLYGDPSPVRSSTAVVSACRSSRNTGSPTSVASVSSIRSASSRVRASEIGYRAEGSTYTRIENSGRCVRALIALISWLRITKLNACDRIGMLVTSPTARTTPTIDNRVSSGRCQRRFTAIEAIHCSCV